MGQTPVVLPSYGLDIRMSNEFDPYREALVMEAATIWPDEYDDWEPVDRRRIEEQLHADPAKASQMEYVRMHTGFVRQITVTPEDLQRLGS
jgi:hypothetical protein